MTKITSNCPKCHKPMQPVLQKTGRREPQCLDCNPDDPLKSSEVAKLLEGELRRPITD